jgi:tetratricopeptide (TPR) repeat protein
LYIALLAGACEIAGQIEEGAARLDQALQLVERTGERWFAAELDRQRGRLLLRQGHPEAAEELYRKALSIAREQEAKMWELRRREPCPTVARPGLSRRRPRPARPGLRLVHRRLRHPRSQSGKGAARRVGMSELCAADVDRASVPRQSMPEGKPQFAQAGMRTGSAGFLQLLANSSLKSAR